MERQYHHDVDGPAQASFALPMWSDGSAGNLLAVLSLRKNLIGSTMRGARPLRFSCDEEAFVRMLAAAAGPLLHMMQSARGLGQKMLAKVSHVKQTQQVWLDNPCCMLELSEH
jgi:hypothetical protein